MRQQPIDNDKYRFRSISRLMQVRNEPRACLSSDKSSLSVSVVIRSPLHMCVRSSNDKQRIKEKLSIKNVRTFSF